MASLLILVPLLAARVAAFPSYPANLPNGEGVPCPPHLTDVEQAEQCGPDGSICRGLGHVDCRGGSIKSANGTFLNPFGEAFADEGYSWSKALCEADSDGDGVSNGQELGDPCCVWTRGAELPQLPQGYKLSHPGLAQDTTTSKMPSISVCNNQRALEADVEAEEKAKVVASFFQPGETRANITMRIDEHTLLANETIYTNHFHPLPQDRTIYATGFAADIVNNKRVHHIVAYLCTLPLSTFTMRAGKPEVPANETMNGDIPDGCERTLYSWAPGSEYFALPKTLHMRLGKDTPYKAVAIQMHYNNVDGVTNETDSSAFEVYYTTKKREHAATWLWTGSILSLGTIPPRSRYFSAARCVLDLQPGCTTVTSVAQFPHAHYLGRRIWVEQYRAVGPSGELKEVGQLHRQGPFSYEAQYTTLLDKPVTLRDGDVFSTTCLYDSSARDEPTPFGLASLEEMCVHAQLVYPEECVPPEESSGCLDFSVNGQVPADFDFDGTQRSTELYTLGASTNFSALLATTTDAPPCNVSGVLDPSKEGFAAFDPPLLAACAPYLQAIAEVTDAAQIENITCGPECVKYMANLGICSVTDLAELWEEADGLGGPASNFFDGNTGKCSNAIRAHLESTIKMPQSAGVPAPTSGSANSSGGAASAEAAPGSGSIGVHAGSMGGVALAVLLAAAV